MDAYPGNSNASRNRPVAKPVTEKSTEEPREKVQKVVTGRVIQRKKGLGTRFRETFLSGGREVGEHILHEVVIPSLKEVAIDAITQFLERGMWRGEERTSRRRPYVTRPSGRNGWVQYGGGGSTSSGGRPYSSRDDREEPRYTSRRERSGFELKEVIFPSHHDADNVLRELEKQTEEYGSASVVDFYDATGMTADYTDERWGWRGEGLQRARIERIGRGEFLLNLPPPERLDP